MLFHHCAYLFHFLSEDPYLLLSCFCHMPRIILKKLFTVFIAFTTVNFEKSMFVGFRVASGEASKIWHEAVHIKGRSYPIIMPSQLPLAQKWHVRELDREMSCLNNVPVNKDSEEGSISFAWSSFSARIMIITNMNKGKGSVRFMLKVTYCAMIHTLSGHVIFLCHYDKNWCK